MTPSLLNRYPNPSRRLYTHHHPYLDTSFGRNRPGLFSSRSAISNIPTHTHTETKPHAQHGQYQCQHDRTTHWTNGTVYVILTYDQRRGTGNYRCQQLKVWPISASNRSSTKGFQRDWWPRKINCVPKLPKGLRVYSTYIDENNPHPIIPLLKVRTAILTSQMLRILTISFTS